MSLRRALVAVPALVALTGLAACGGGDDDALDDGSTPVTEGSAGTEGQPADLNERFLVAEEKTRQAGTAAIDVDMDLSVAGEGLTIDMVGVTELSAGTADLTMTFDVPGVELDPMHMVTDGSLVWISEDDSTWYEIAASEFEEAGSAPASLDAGTYLTFLRDAGGDIEEVGSEDIDGTATHYRTEIAIADFLAAQSNQAGAEALEAAGVETLPVNVFIGEDGLVRRVAIALDAEVEGETMTMNIEADYTDFGEVVEIATPPAGEIVPGSPDTLGTLMSD